MNRIACLLLMVLTATARAEVIPTGLRTIWEGRVGVEGGIPARSTIYTTLGSTASVAQINTALSNCPSNQVVQLLTGTYAVGTEIIIPKSGVTLRGGGAGTVLRSTASGAYGNVYFSGSGIYQALANGNFAGLVNWTNGFSQGESNIVVNTASNLTVGTIVCLDQTLDSWQSVSGTDGGPTGPTARTFTRPQVQWAKVKAIAGRTITIWPPLQMTNWQASLTPQLWWIGGWIERSGIENLMIDGRSSAPFDPYAANVYMFGTWDCWVSNVWSIAPKSTHVNVYGGGRTTVNHCWLYDNQSSYSMSYGVLLSFAGHSLIEDNVFNKVTGPVIMGQSAAGNVTAYNYVTNVYYVPYAGFTNWLSAAFWTHDAHACMNLFEGNVGTMGGLDFYHGSGSHNTFFRNRLTGWETNKAQFLHAMSIAQTNYWINMVGNVLGTAGVHDTYDSYGGAANSIYFLGTDASEAVHDTNVIQRLYRHGNWDVVNATTLWDTNNADHTIPSSLYLASKPSWFGGNVWPSIGPDLSPMTNSIPAQSRFAASIVPYSPVTPTAAATNRTPLLRPYLQSNLDGAGYAGTNFYVGQTNVMGPARHMDVLTYVTNSTTGTNSVWTNLYRLEIISATNLLANWTLGLVLNATNGLYIVLHNEVTNSTNGLYTVVHQEKIDATNVLYITLNQQIINSTNGLYAVMPVVKAGTNVLVVTNSTTGVKEYAVELNSTVWNLINTKAGTNNPTLYGMVVYGDALFNGTIQLGDNVISNTVDGKLRFYNGGLESYADLVADGGGIMYLVARLNVTNLVGVISTDNLPGYLPGWSLLSTNAITQAVVAPGTYITITTNTVGGVTSYTITGTPGTNPAPTGVITWDIAGGTGRNGDVRMDRSDITNILTGTITNATTGNAATATHASTADYSQFADQAYYLLQQVITNLVSITNILQAGASTGDAIKWNGTTWAATAMPRDIPVLGTAISVTTNAGANNTYSISVSGLTSNEVATVTDAVYRQRDIPIAGTNVVVVVTNTASGANTYALSVANLSSNEVATATDADYRRQNIPLPGSNVTISSNHVSSTLNTFTISASTGAGVNIDSSIYVPALTASNLLTIPMSVYDRVMARFHFLSAGSGGTENAVEVTFSAYFDPVYGVIDGIVGQAPTDVQNNILDGLGGPGEEHGVNASCVTNATGVAFQVYGAENANYYVHGYYTKVSRP